MFIIVNFDNLINVTSMKRTTETKMSILFMATIQCFCGNYSILFGTSHRTNRIAPIESRFQSHALLCRGRMLFHTETAESRRPIYSLLFGPEHMETRQNDKSVLFLRIVPASRIL
jgi:hypothetical protein